MELLIKPTTKDLDDYIKIGAKSFAFGIKDFSSFASFVLTINDLKNMVKKYSNCDIFVILDKNIFEGEIDYLKDVLFELDKICIKGLFFYDEAVLNICLENKLKIRLIANQNFLLTNYEICNFYNNMGCEGAVVTTELTKDEIKEIIEKAKLDIYVNVFGYQLMAFSKRLLVSDYFKKIKKVSFKKNNYMIKDDKKYLIEEDKEGTVILSNYILNGLNYLNYFNGARYIILNEKQIEHKVFLDVFKVYKKAIDTNDYSFKLSFLDNLSSGFFDTRTIYKVK